jgi:hypothetical protein
VVKQRSEFAPRTEIDGLPAAEVGRLLSPPALPAWALNRDDLPDMLAQDPAR